MLNRVIDQKSRTIKWIINGLIAIVWLLVIAELATGVGIPFFDATAWDQIGFDQDLPACSLQARGELERRGDRIIQRYESSFETKGEVVLGVRNRNGDVRVIGWAGDEVLVSATKSFSPPDGPPTGVARAVFERVPITVHHGSRDIKVDAPAESEGGSVPPVTVDFTILVPFDSSVYTTATNGDLTVESVRGDCSSSAINGSVVYRQIGGKVGARLTNGDLYAEAVKGGFFGETTNGGIHLDRVGGIALVYTQNGNIEVIREEALAGSDDLDLRTANGSVRLTLPEDSGFNLDVRTSNGSIRSDFYLEPTNPSVSHRMMGRVGKVGGPNVSLESVNGPIEIVSEAL